MPILIDILATLTLAPTTHAQETRTIRPTEPQADLQLEEILSIGSLSGEHDAFGRLGDIALDSHGRILVADRQGPRIRGFPARRTPHANRLGLRPYDEESVHAELPGRATRPGSRLPRAA